MRTHTGDWRKRLARIDVCGLKFSFPASSMALLAVIYRLVASDNLDVALLMVVCRCIANSTLSPCCI